MDIEPPATPTIESAGNKRKANKQACKPCRQAKARCDGKSDFTKRCSRCERLNNVCERDSEYKRVPKKAKFDELEQQVRYLQAVVNLNTAQTNAQTDHPPAAAGLLEHTRASSVVSLSDGTEHQIPISLLGDPATSKSDHPSTAYQTEILPDSRYQSSISFQARTTGLLPEFQAGQFQVNENLNGSMVSNYIPEDHSQAPTNTAGPTTMPSHKIFQQDRLATPRSIGSVSLDSDQICSLFKVYFEKSHPYLNFLDSSISPDGYYSRSPLLYWVIVSIASHRWEDDPTLLGMLSQPVQNLLWATIRKLPHSPFVVEAIILFSMWPLPMSSMWTDPSLMLISIAKTSAMQLGLHRPEHIQDFSRVERRLSSKGIHDSVRIWAACYISAQCIASSNGQESILKPDQMIIRACDPNNTYELPVELHHFLRLMKFSVHISQTMSENLDNLSGLPNEQDRDQILDRLETEFENLKSELGANATNPTKLYIYYTQLQLQVFYFFEGIHPETRKEGLLKCYETSSKAIETMVLAESDHSPIIYAPYHMLRIMIIAGIVIMRILNSSYSELVDFNVGKRNFYASIRLLRQSSLQDNDNPGRGSKILSQLWIHYQNSPSIKQRPPNLQVKSRLGGSLLHDSLWVWRRECDDQKNSHRSTRQNSPLKSPQQDWAIPPIPNRQQSYGHNNEEMNDMLNFSGMENLDMDWLEGDNLLSWFLPTVDLFDSNPPVSGPAI